MSDHTVSQQVRAGLVVPVIGALLLGYAAFNTVQQSRSIDKARAEVVQTLPTPTPSHTKSKKKKEKKKKAGGS